MIRRSSIATRTTGDTGRDSSTSSISISSSCRCGSIWRSWSYARCVRTRHRVRAAEDLPRSRSLQTHPRGRREASSMKHRSDIDGLRAVAVLAVVLFHARVPGTSGGFVGVDIFFVISGYLISSIIATELRANTFSVVKFYERRCRRILPALFVMFAVVFVLAAAVLLPPDMVAFCRSLLSATFFVSNIYFWKTSTYFEGASQFKPLLHTWSLGVEEQFYIVMPLVLMLVARRARAAYAPWLLGLFVGSLLLSVWGVTHAPNATFYVLPTRFWELTTGALVTLGMRKRTLPRPVLELIGAAGLGLCVGSIALLSEVAPFPGWYALIPCLGAAAILYQGAIGDSAVTRILSAKPLVFIGQISYSLYLWHWPLLSLAKYEMSTRTLSGLEVATVLVAAFLVSVASWRSLNDHFERMPGNSMRLRYSKSARRRGAFTDHRADRYIHPCNCLALSGLCRKENTWKGPIQHGKVLLVGRSSA